MSQLNLTPDAVVLASQATIFLANMFVVNKLILTPYLKVRAKREASTGGSQDEALKLVNEAKTLEVKITDKMREAHKDAALLREKIKSEATQKRQTLLAEAEKNTKSAQASIEKEIEDNLRDERSKKDKIIGEVTDFLIAQTTR